MKLTVGQTAFIGDRLYEFLYLNLSSLTVIVPNLFYTTANSKIFTVFCGTLAEK
jgi:hypothetical protein